MQGFIPQKNRLTRTYCRSSVTPHTFKASQRVLLLRSYFADLGYMHHELRCDPLYPELVSQFINERRAMRCGNAPKCYCERLI